MSNSEQLQENNETLNNVRTTLSSLPTATEVAQQHQTMLDDLSEIKSVVSSGVAQETTSQEILSAVSNGLAQETTNQEILSVGAKESTSQEIKSLIQSGGSSFPNYSTTLTGQSSTSSSSPTTITGKGRFSIFYGTESSANVYLDVDDAGYVTTYICNGMVVEIYFNQKILFYTSKTMYYVAQVE